MTTACRQLQLLNVGRERCEGLEVRRRDANGVVTQLTVARLCGESPPLAANTRCIALLTEVLEFD